ncbi:hypothetical protein AYI68_g256 [Smittium mucronatum]|uniref:Uncharacterized protein n=1 Tax=Smittium mucronatum TaxID=133383 RepID=A0A1R0H8N2_9FUNG|nr:hypothetical protein AYI68_g256 [Smittium mucronatum]
MEKKCCLTEKFEQKCRAMVFHMISNKPCIDFYSSKINRSIYIMTKRKLIESSSLSRNLHIDLNFRPIQGDYPLIISSFTNINQELTPVAMGIMKKNDHH